MNQRLLIFTSLLIAGAGHAQPAIKVIASTVAGSSTQVVAGEPSLVWWANTSSLGRVHGSFDGRFFAFAGLIDDPTDRKQAWCTGEVDDSSTWRTPFIEDRPWPLDGSLTIDDNRTVMAVGDDGKIVFAGNVSGATTSDDYILRYDNGTYSVIAQEGQTPSGSPIPYATVLGGCSMSTSSGQAYYQSGGNSSSQPGGLWREGNLLVQRGVTTANWGPTPIIINFFESDKIKASQSGDSSLLMQARLNAAATEDSVVILGSTVVAREGHLLPGELVGSPVSSLDTALGTSTYSQNGAHYTFRGSRASGLDFAVFARPSANPWDLRLVINENTSITPGSSESWSGTGSNVFGGQTFQVAAVNSYGDKLLGGYTTAPVGSNYIFVFNGRQVLLRSGAPIDLNGNSLFDDDCFFNQVVSDNCVLSEGNRVLVGVTLRNAAGTVTGLSILSFDAPLPGDANGDGEVGPADFTLLSAAFGSSLGDPNYNSAADFDLDEEVGPSDFTILSANFGRTR